MKKHFEDYASMGLNALKRATRKALGFLEKFPLKNQIK